MPTPAVDFFRERGACFPELCFLTSAAVGFPVAVYTIGPPLSESGWNEYQVMRWDEAPGPGLAFWDWHLFECPQFFADPEAACVAFVASRRAWIDRGGSPD